ATGPPTGSMSGRPPVAAAWTGNTKLTVKPSKTSTCTRWSAMPGNAYAVISSGKQIRVTFFNDTWVWDGTTWIQKFPATSPSPRVHAGMAYDKARQQVVLFGGANNPITLVLGDTWVWDGVN